LPRGESRPGPDSGEGPGRRPTVEYAVLCGPEDLAAVWAARALRATGLDVRVVTTQELVYSTSLRHTVSRDGGATAAVRLGDGTLFGPDLRGTLNRMTWVPAEHLAGAATVDRDYARQELGAVLTSLVHGLPGVVLGRPDGRGLSGVAWRPCEWMVRAGRAGLLVPGYRTGVAARPAAGGIPVVVVGEEVTAPRGVEVPPDVAAGVRRLARDHGSGLLGVDLVPGPAGWLVADVTPRPDLRRVGEPVVAALRAALLDRDRVPA
jgi:hypothetical protein